MNLSFWEKQSLTHYNHIVIGCGFVGMHIALQLRKKFPEQSILVLERGLLPEGASTKNAGFACTGSPTELLADIDANGEEAMQQLFEMRFRGLNYTRNLLGDAAIGYTDSGSHELLSGDALYALDKLPYLNELLHSIIGRDAFEQDDIAIGNAGMNVNTFKAAVKHHTEAALDTGKLVLALQDLCLQQGVHIKFGSQVQSIDDSTAKKLLHCVAHNNAFDFSCDNVFIATNAFAKTLLPNIDLTPGRGQVLVTKPIDGLRLQGIYHMNEGYFYCRELYGRVLFGGGRNLDFSAEATTDFDTTSLVQNELLTQLQNDILPNTAFEVDYTWSGIMAFGNKKQAIIEHLGNSVFCAVRCGGMGVAIAPIVAETCVAMVQQ
ncbi:MAG: hypothetical protein RL660_127 [Bacteroidota bacterium]|jgi:glycine/D-amino acid oxidase-like deaminating enzyme